MVSSRNPSTLPEVVLTRREFEFESVEADANGARLDSVAAQVSAVNERNSNIGME